MNLDSAGLSAAEVADVDFHLPVSASSGASAAAPPAPPVFEWLTEPALLVPLIVPLLPSGDSLLSSGALLVDVGCGRSSLGLDVFRALPPSSQSADVLVLNFDNLPEVISDCRRLYGATAPPNVRWVHADASAVVSAPPSSPPRPYGGVYFASSPDSESFPTPSQNTPPLPPSTPPLFTFTPPSSPHLHSPRFATIVLDKGGLDCLLTSPPLASAASFLCNVANMLSPNRAGTYFCVSYHEPSFLLPVLECVFDAAAIRWEKVSRGNKPHQPPPSSSSRGGYGEDDLASPWTSGGTFAPSAGYDSEVYCYVCRSGVGDSPSPPVLSNVCRRLSESLDSYYKTVAPMATPTRVAELREAWCGRGALPLDEVYCILFDDAEKDLYTLEDFFGDVAEFFEEGGEDEGGDTVDDMDFHASEANAITMMTMEQAIQFLIVMQ